MSQVKVSVIIAAYGQEAYLGDTLASLQAQTLQEWEAIVVDDGSPDNVAAVAREWAGRDSRIRFLHTDNHGVGAARNSAAALASGEYLVVLDGDDILGSDYLRICSEALDRDSRLKVALTQMRCFGVRDDVWEVRYEAYPQLLINNPLYVSAMMRTADFKAAGGFDASMTLGLEDWEFWIRLLNGTGPEAVYVDSAMMFFYRQKEVSRNTEAVGDKERLSKCNGYIFGRHRSEYHRWFGDIVTPDRMPLLDWWMLRPLAMWPGWIGGEADMPARERNVEASARNVARCDALPVELRRDIITRLARLPEPQSDKASNQISGKLRRRLALMRRDVDAYMRMMRLTERLSLRYWLRPKSINK